MPVRNTSPVMLLLCAALVLGACATGRAPVRRAQSVPGLTIDDAALRQWSFLFEHIDAVEWLACLYGREEGPNLHIDRSELADVRDANYAAVSGICTPRPGTRLVGLAHSHPPFPDGRPSCLPSSMDTRDLGRPWRIIIVVCDTDERALTLGFRVHGRHPVIGTLAVPAAVPPLALGGAQPTKQD